MTNPTDNSPLLEHLIDVLERVDDFIVDMAGDQPTMDFCIANPAAGDVLLMVREAIADARAQSEKQS